MGRQRGLKAQKPPRRATSLRRADHCQCFERPELEQQLHQGLRAMRSHSTLVSDAKEASCSFRLDECFSKKREKQKPGEKKWDYAIVTRHNLGIAIEVHPATPGEVSNMIGKKHWACEKLKELCPRLGVDRWLWVLPPNSRFAPTALTPKRRLLQQAGITGPYRRVALVEPPKVA